MIVVSYQAEELQSAYQLHRKTEGSFPPPGLARAVSLGHPFGRQRLVLPGSADASAREEGPPRLNDRRTGPGVLSTPQEPITRSVTMPETRQLTSDSTWNASSSIAGRTGPRFRDLARDDDPHVLPPKPSLDQQQEIARARRRCRQW